MKIQARNSQNSLGEKKKSRGFTLPDFKTYYKATDFVCKLRLHGTGIRINPQINRIELEVQK